MQTRDKIIDQADQLFYRQGFDHTSFADIAGVVGISRGNFYHHFKTKDDILDAVIANRLARTQDMLHEWDGADLDPVHRIALFIDILLRNQTAIMEHGCPVGSLCGELAKLGHDALPHAGGVFGLFRNWLRLQFQNAGCESRADDLAMHLLMRSQGVALLATTFRDAAFVRREVDAMHQWVRDQIPQQ